MQTLVLFDNFFRRHNPGFDRPESPDRFSGLEMIFNELSNNVKISCPQRVAASSELCLAHEEKYVQHILQQKGCEVALDEETLLSPDSVDVALHAVGACFELVEGIYAGITTNGFALIRPPGHHAEKAQGMGYCIFNNAALAAIRARQLGAQRVLIVDWDAHRGNGTQQIFAGRKDIRVFSIHQRRLFPKDELKDDFPGANLSVPMLPGAGDNEYHEVFNQVLAPFAEEYLPDFLIVSAGFDAHIQDPMSDLRLTTSGFAMLCTQLTNLAKRYCSDRMAMILEGGYDVDSLRKSIRVCLDVMARS